jgi:hypothetical protein
VRRKGAVRVEFERGFRAKRACSGCLGTGGRRRAWLAARSLGEPQAGVDPGVPEWGNLAGVNPVIRLSRRRTWGTETSQYLEEEKARAIFRVAASERGRAQTVEV